MGHLAKKTQVAINTNTLTHMAKEGFSFGRFLTRTLTFTWGNVKLFSPPTFCYPLFSNPNKESQTNDPTKNRKRHFHPLANPLDYVGFVTKEQYGSMMSRRRSNQEGSSLMGNQRI